MIKLIFISMFMTMCLMTNAQVKGQIKGQAKAHKSMHFNSVHGNFTLETPIGWKEITLQDSDSFDGLIAMGRNDTLYFSFGAWRSRFFYGYVQHGEGDNMETPVRVYPATINGCKAYRDATPEPTTSQQGEDFAYVDMGWPRCFYIDTVYVVGRDAMRFDLWGAHLTEPGKALFYQVVKTIRFDRKTD
jgi:hypothetical protein